MPVVENRCCPNTSNTIAIIKLCNHTYKFLWTEKVKQLYHPKIIARDDVKARVGHAGTGDVCFVSVTGPDPYDLVPKDTGYTHSEIFLSFQINKDAFCYSY